MLPPASKFRLEILTLLKERGNEGALIRELYPEIANNLNLSYEQREILVNSKAELRYHNFSRSACTTLAKKGLVRGKEEIEDKSRANRWFISKKGINYLNQIK
ncbi:winged helix-turn-helix domain-containing protein [Bacillus sonorensis]